MAHARTDGLNNTLLFGLRGDHHDRRIEIVGTNAFNERQAIHLRHMPAGENHIRLNFSDLFKCFFACGGLKYISVAHMFQYVPDYPPHGFGLFGDKYFHERSAFRGQYNHCQAIKPGFPLFYSGILCFHQVRQMMNCRLGKLRGSQDGSDMHLLEM